MNRQIKYEDSVSNGNSTEEDTVNVMNGTVINEAEGNKKRSDYISWGDYFMGVAYLSARRSKDPRTQVGACIVNKENIIVSTGYNGMPYGCDDDVMPWGKSDDTVTDKHSYVIHAEMNAVLNKNSSDVKDCTAYVTLYPCTGCTKLLIQAGIKEVLYLYSKHHKKEAMEASKLMFEQAGIKCSQFTPQQRQIKIDFGTQNWSPLSVT